ncbi:MAG: hypothetical protein HFG59_07795 [Lachnospiraceae bacterium]|nr:hypothetical protein [Lachnospiraceae bacterium]
MKAGNGIRRAAAVVLAVMMAMAVVPVAMAAEKKEQQYAFTYKEQQITVGMAADTALKAFGKENKVKTLANCADDNGKDKAYIYDDFEVIITKEGKKEVVQSIRLTSGNVGTEEGIKVGDLPAAVKKAYPDAKEEAGLYTVVLGDSQLVIDCGFKNDKVVEICYEAAGKK